MRFTYEITDEMRAVHGVMLNRIRALPGNKFAAPGVLGGWIEREENLADGAWVASEACTFENAQVYDGALVSGRAQVYGNGHVFEGATIFEEAKVFGNAIVSGKAYIAGRSEVYENATVIGRCFLNDFTRIHGDATVCEVDVPIFLELDTEIHGGRWSEPPYFQSGSTWNVNVTSPISFRIGCMDYPFSRWPKSWKAIARLGKEALAKRLGETTEITDELIAEYLQYFNKACDATGNQEYKTDLATLLHE